MRIPEEEILALIRLTGKAFENKVNQVKKKYGVDDSYIRGLMMRPMNSRS
jgi:hypothetical protein